MLQIFRWLGALTILTLVACVSAPVKPPPKPAPPNAKKELSQAQIDLAAGSEKKAIQRLKNLIAKNPKSDVADDATMLLARIYYSHSLFEPAYQSYMGLVNSDVFSPNEGEALLGASRSLTKLGRLDEALSLNSRALKIPGLTPITQLELHRQRYSLYSALGDRLDALKDLAYIYENDPKAENKANAQARASEIVSMALTQGDLEKVVSSSEFGFVRPQAALRLGVLRLQAKDLDGARSSLGQAADLGQGTPIQKQAESYLAQLDSRRRVDSNTIGAVLPLSGKHSPIAQKTLHGLQLGLGIYGTSRSSFRLAVIDSEGTPEGAKRAVDRLVGEDSVIAVVGSLLSRTAPAVAQKTEELGVPSIALSQRAGITEVGSYIFRNAVTSEMQVKELVRIAMEQMGLKRFAILYPNDSYGVEYANLFWDEVLLRGGTVTGAQIYNPQETDFRGPIRRLVGTYYIEDRKGEYQSKLAEWFRKQKGAKGRNAPPDDLLPPIIDFEALFVPDSPKALGQIAPMLAYQNVTGIRLLGTNIWNTPELIRRGQKNVENAVFVDSNMGNDPVFKASRFYQEYKQAFGEEPGLFEAQGYETGLLLRQLIERGERTRVGLAQALAGIRQYQGVAGPMSMNQQRELVRPLKPLIVKEGSILSWNPTLEPEPETPTTKQKNRVRR
jgi:ABC-type branched-subunit amino acid transport system substrate-binding protein